jgi:hypothetical protein
MILKNSELRKRQHVQALNSLLTYMRKRKVTNLYETDYFDSTISLVGQNLNILDSPERISAFAFTLLRTHHKKVQPYVAIEKELRENAMTYSLQALSNILFSFTYIARR